MAATPKTSTSLILTGYGQLLILKTTPVSSPAESGSALVRVLSTPVRPHFREHFSGRGFLNMPVPFSAGNCAIARILSVGADAVYLVPGQLVFVHGFVTARDDAQGTQVLFGLHRGNGTASERAGHLFDTWKGLWREIASVPLENCVALDETRLVGDLGYSFTDLVYLDRLSVAYGSVSAAGLLAGETVIVAPATGHYSGAVAEVAAQLGCRVIACTRTANKVVPLAERHRSITPLELTGDQKADVDAIRALCPRGSLGADAYIDVSPPQATTSPHHFNVGLQVLRPGGRAILTGALMTATIPYMSLMLRNIRVIGKWLFSQEEMLAVVRMVEAGVIKLGKQAGHENVQGGFKFEDWERALEVAEQATEWGRHVAFVL